ncbi:MAG: hypothetical protein ABIT58_01260 [Ferruginibacter sp.]
MFQRNTMLPLTRLQKQMLQDGYKRNVNNEPPIGTYYTQTAKGLVSRGLFEMREYFSNGKKRTGFFITTYGIGYQDRLASRMC